MGSGVNITDKERLYLGAAIGTSAYVSLYVSQKVKQWSNELRMLADIATTQPHVAHAALKVGLSGKWTFLTCTIGHLFQPLEDTLRHEFIPALTG